MLPLCAQDLQPRKWATVNCILLCTGLVSCWLCKVNTQFQLVPTLGQGEQIALLCNRRCLQKHSPANNHLPLAHTLQLVRSLFAHCVPPLPQTGRCSGLYDTNPCTQSGAPHAHAVEKSEESNAFEHARFASLHSQRLVFGRRGSAGEEKAQGAVARAENKRVQSFV